LTANSECFYLLSWCISSWSLCSLSKISWV